MHADDSVPIGLAHIEDHPVAKYARDIDDDIEFPEFRHCRLDQPPPRRNVGDVARVSHRAALEIVDLFGDAMHRAIVAASAVRSGSQIVDDQIRALSRKGEGNGRADSLSCSRDDRGTAFQDTHAQFSVVDVL